MQLKVNDIILEIPEELINNMEKVLCFESRTQLINEIMISVNALKDCSSEKELKEKSLNERVIEYLQDEIGFFQ